MSVHLIIGGRYMGKLAYAQRLYGPGSVCDLAEREPEAMFGAEITVNLQEGVRLMLKRGDAALSFFRLNLERLRDKILIGDEVGSGVVPVDPFERLWRDETGLLYQLLASEADLVDRVWAGIPQRLKG